MNKTLKFKIATDVVMTVLLLFLMSYQLAGDTAHEWLGVAMFVAFIVHHILNRRWSAGIIKGKYSVMRVIQTVLAIVILLCMACSMISGVLLSNHLFTFIRVRGVAATARRMHMICAYWGFVFMSLHLGIHWNMVVRMAGKCFKNPSALRSIVAKTLAAVVAVYGIRAFIKREIGSYMLLKIHFVFFAPQESLLLFILDYMAVMALFVWIGYYGSRCINQFTRKGIKER